MTSAATTVISDTGRRYLHLHLTDEVGPVRLRNLLNHFGTLDAVLRASMAELERVEQIGPHTARSIFASRGEDHVQREIDRAEQSGVRIVCLEDPSYPALLKRVPDPPACLYIRGSLEPTDAVAVAIVGSRRCSHYGLEQARRFGEGLGRAGFTVISGLARGIDSIAHKASIDAGGRTIGVLGNGLASVYPPEHELLADQVTGCGALMSELAMDQAPEGKNFPPRNRIIAGMALGVLVIEAGSRSGALITARLSADYNREVFALPGRVDQPMYAGGTNGMIRDGWARLVTGVDDLLDDLADVGRIMRSELGAASARDDGETPDGGIPSHQGRAVSSPADATAVSLSADEQRVYQAITADPVGLEQICNDVGLAPGRVTSLLTGLQLKGVVRQLPGNHYARKHPA